MKVTIDGILNTAINIKNQKDHSPEESKKTEKQNTAYDSIEIRSRLSSRLGRIQGELKNLQSSLTKNQIIKNGLSQLIDDLDNETGRISRILEQVRFDKKQILSEFLDDNINYDNIIKSSKKVDKLIEKDIVDLKSLQVEVENISASNLADAGITAAISDIENSLSKIDLSVLSKITDIKPDSVAGLLR